MALRPKASETSRREATAAEARALASPLRMRILRICLGEPRTNKEIADVLGKDPASTLHHVRTLVDNGFLVAGDARRGTRGSREIPYRATGKSWTLSGSPGTSGILLDAFVEEVALVPAESVDSARLGLRMDPATHAEFLDRIQAVFDDFAARSDAATEGGAWSVYFAIHPDPNRPDSH